MTTARVMDPTDEAGEWPRAITSLLNGDDGWGRDVSLLESLTVGNGLTVTGGALIAGGLTVSSGGAAITGNSTVTGTLNVTSTLTAQNGLTQSAGATSLTGTTFSGTYSSTWTASATSFGWTGPTTLTGNLLVQNSDTDQLIKADVTAGAQLLYVGETLAPMMKVDIADQKVYLGGSATALTSATADKVIVQNGRLYTVANNEDQSIGLRYSLSVSGSFFIGASNSNTPDLLAKNNAGTQIARAMNAGGLIVGTSTAFVGSEKLLVNGGALFQGATTISTGGATISGGMSLNGGLIINDTGASITGPLTVSTTTTITAGGLTVTAGGLTVTAGGLTVSANGANIVGGLNSNTSGAATGEIKAASHIRGDRMYLGLQSTYFITSRSATKGTGTTVDFGAIYGWVFFQDSNGQACIVLAQGGVGNVTTVYNSDATIWNINSDAGSNWAFYWSGSSYILKNRSVGDLTYIAHEFHS